MANDFLLDWWRPWAKDSHHAGTKAQPGAARQSFLERVEFNDFLMKQQGRATGAMLVMRLRLGSIPDGEYGIAEQIHHGPARLAD